MSFMEVDGARMHYRFDGPAGSPVLVFSNSLGTNLYMWDPQIPALTPRFRVLRYDTRGHGLSAVAPEPYTMERLGLDVVGLLDGLELERVYFCGLSLGGMIGIWLGGHAGNRLNGLVLCSTAARIGSAETWNARIAKVREGGMSAITAAVIERWFTSDFAANFPEAIERTRQMLLQSSAAGYTSCCAAVRDADLGETLAGVKTRTMVIAGSRDPVTPPADGRFLAGHIAGARYVELEAAHLSNVEAASQFTEALMSFLTEREAKK